MEEETTTFRPYKPLPPPPKMLTVREDSRAISKSKPKIKIVHIVAPQVIKTDAANFRALVQRLTGKPLRRAAGKKKAAERCMNGDAEVGLGLMREGGRSEAWIGEESNDFLGGVEDVDGFFEGLGDCSLLPCSSSSSTQVELGGEEEHVC